MAELPPWHVHADVWLVLGSVMAGYLLVVYRLGRRVVPRGERPVTPHQVALFSAGMAVLLAGSVWPMHDVAEGYLYSAHMVQHMLFTLLAPPLLLRGTPDWLLRLVLKPFMPLARVRMTWRIWLLT